VWTAELKDDPDRDFILTGIAEGFHLVDKGSEIKERVRVANSKRATQNKEAVDKVLQNEIAEGQIKKTNSPPDIINALSAIEKPNGDIRLILDCSRPDDLSLNDYATHESYKYESVQTVLEQIGRGWYMAKVDLKSAYRCVPIHPDNYNFTGMEWMFTGDSYPSWCYDTRLPFGGRKSPGIFHRITQAVKRLLVKKGLKAIVVYLDDFLVMAATFQECLQAYSLLIQTLRSLGFQINWQKVVDPCQKVTFLGVNIDTVAGTVALDPSKLTSFIDCVKEFRQKKRASKRQLQHLAGKLSWASNVIDWGKLHTRGIFNAIAHLKKAHHKHRMKELYGDLEWWLFHLTHTHNQKHIWDDRPGVAVVTDACPAGGGAFCNQDWLYRAWHVDQPAISTAHINVKELAIIEHAARRWLPQWRNQRVVAYTDNAATAAVINKGTSASPAMLPIIRRLSYLAQQHNFSLQAVYIPGQLNTLADSISRLHQPGYFQRFITSMCNSGVPPVLSYRLSNHMSLDAVAFVFPQALKWNNLHKSWTQR
jgi:hypothetical protein